MSAPGVSVVIPVWNSRELLLRLLAALRAQTYPIAEVIAVDNGSTDGAGEAARKQGARVLPMGANLGFARAANAGIEASGSELIALVNSDVEPAPDWLARLVDAVQPPGVWFAAGKLLIASRPDRIDGTYDLVSRGGCAWRVGQSRPDGPEFSQGRPIAIAPATATLFRAELFQRVGLFDIAFESYLEDVDFGLRCASLGLGGFYVPDAVAKHQGSASLGAWSPRMVRLVARNQVLLAAKHCPRRYWWAILVGQSLWGLVALRHGAAFAFLQGKLAGLRSFRSQGGGQLAKILEKSEREIAEIQRRTGFDWYWSVYFLLTAGRFDI
jgi:hypothetical protein